MPTFNGDTLTITLDLGVYTVDVKEDLYSSWKLWAKTGDNMKYPLAFDTAGGDPTSATAFAAPFYFLRNDIGWHLYPPEQDGTFTLNGNLYPREPALPMVLPTLGGYTALLLIERDASAVVAVTGSGVLPSDITAIAAAVAALPEWGEVGVATVDPAAVGEIVAGLAALPVETSATMVQAMRLMLAALAGKVSGAAGPVVTFRNAVDDSKNRIVATVDDEGNRTAVTVDVT